MEPPTWTAIFRREIVQVLDSVQVVVLASRVHQRDECERAVCIKVSPF